MVRSPSFTVPKRLGSKAIQVLKRLHLINHGLKIWCDEKLHIPLLRCLDKEELDFVKLTIPEFIVEEEDFRERKRSPRTLIEALRDKLPPHLLTSIPKSLDLIGRLAVLEVPPELDHFKGVIGNAMLDVYRSVETVLAKAGSVGTEFRLRDYEVIAGTGVTETTYKEYGCSYLLDPTKVFFTPRLGSERWRVAQDVRPREKVLDMFAGVGPFSILIAKTHPDVIVYAIDLNPFAVMYLEKNIALNRVSNRVFPIHGDAMKAAPTILRGLIDRVIMNLPEKALSFVSAACQAIKQEGGVIHYYAFKDEPGSVRKAELELRTAVEEAERKVLRVKFARPVREIAPRRWQVVVDAVIY